MERYSVEKTDDVVYPYKIAADESGEWVKYSDHVSAIESKKEAYREMMSSIVFEILNLFTDSPEHNNAVKLCLLTFDKESQKYTQETNDPFAEVFLRTA